MTWIDLPKDLVVMFIVQQKESSAIPYNFFKGMVLHNIQWKNKEK
jgi:hypothetical protein